MPGAYSVRSSLSGRVVAPSWDQLDDDENSSDMLSFHVDLVEEQATQADSRSPHQSSVNQGEMDSNNEIVVTSHDFFVAEASAQIPDAPLLIEGVKTANPMHQRICIIFGSLVFFSVVAMSVGIITHVITSSSHSSHVHSSNTSMASNSPSGVYESYQASTSGPSTSPYGGNINWTISEGFYSQPNLASSILLSKGGNVFLDTLNRTDTNFTVFGFSKWASLPESVPLTLVTKMIGSLWSGHVLDAFEGLIIDGQVLEMEDMQDGMVLTSVSGYPLLIQLDPFRVNNNTISMGQHNLRYSNGVEHVCDNFPTPPAPWVGNSIFDGLLKTNTRRKGDLSVFIALLNAVPELKQQLELQEGNNNATTLFIPTNNALLNYDSSLSVFATDTSQHVNSTLKLLLLNHFVVGNFVRRCWWVIPTGTQLSDSELTLYSQAGNALNVSIEDLLVTVNGDSNIVEGDIFSENGIFHIIDKPLLPPSR